MRQKFKKLIALILVFALMPALPVYAAPLVVESGVISGVEGAAWRLYDDGHLVVSEGRINNITGVSPWIVFASSITHITFEGPIIAGNSLRALFLDLANVTTIDGLELFDTSNVTNMHSLFSGMSSVTSLNVAGWDTSRVTSMGSMFQGAMGLTSLDVSMWDTSSVTSINHMFRETSIVTLDVSGWDTSRVVNMSSMFYSAVELTTLDVSTWDTSSVVNMSHMFRETNSLIALDVSGWDTSLVTNMATMFYGASLLTTLDVSGWDTSAVTSMSRMFSNAVALTSLDVSGWDTSNVTDMVRLFQGASSLTALDVSGWNTGNATNMAGMFQEVTITSLDVSNWDTGNVTNMDRMFQDATGFTSIDVSGWNTSNVTNMGSMFFGATGLTALDVSNWDTSRVTNMAGMFRNAGALATLNVSNWDTARVASMATMFYNASALTVLDVSGWETRSVTNMDRMFINASGLAVLDVSNWYTGNVTNMNSMFRNVSGISQLDVSGWDTKNVNNMPNMFRDVSGVSVLDVSGWDTGNVTSMLSLFQGASSVTSLDLSGWNTGNVTTMNNMFFGASSLTALDLSGWDVSSVASMSSMFRSASSLTSLDLTGWNTRRAPAAAVNMLDMFRDATALRRITFGDDFVNEGTNDPRLPGRASNAEFTGNWLNIAPPGGMLPIPSNVLFPPGGGGPYASGIWVWERLEGIVMISVDGTHRFPTVAVGYSPVAPLSVAVANAGQTVINVPLDITITGANANDFVLTYGNLPPGGIIPVLSSWADAFSIAPANGLQPGTYTAVVSVSGIGINTETFTVTFTVLPDSVENAVITFADAVFDGSPKEPAFTVTLEGEILTAGIDYEIVAGSWVNNIYARNYNDTNPPSVTIRGIGAFDRADSEATRAFTIRRRPVTLTRGNISFTKAYDGTTSPAGATQAGALALGNLVANDSLRVRAEWASKSDFSGSDVGTYDVTLFGLSLVSINNDGRHLNYDLGIAMLTEIPAHITPVPFSPILPVLRTVTTGAVRTVTIPISELVPVPIAPRTLGLVSDISLHNYSPGVISGVATISGGDLVITTQAGKTFPSTETITVRFDTQNFGNIDVPVVLTTAESATFNITYAITGTEPATIGNMPTTPQGVAAGTTNVAVAPWPTTDATTNGDGIAGTWTFSGWGTTSNGVTLAGTAPNQTFIMPGNDVAFTGSWSFSASAPVITITTHPAAATVVSGAALNVNLSVVASVTQGAIRSYQWFSNTSNSNVGGTLIPGATGSTFQVPDIFTVGTFYFYVVVSAPGAVPVASNVAIIVVAQEDIRGIALSPGGNHTFPAAYFGYGLQGAHAVTIANTGNLPTGPLGIGLSGADAGSFELSITSVGDIAVGGSVGFTVRPIIGLGVGVHSAIVTVTGQDVLESFVVSFTVNAAATPTPSPAPSPSPTPVTPSPTPIVPTPTPIAPTPTPIVPTPSPVAPTPTPIVPTPSPTTPTPPSTTPSPLPATPTPLSTSPSPSPATSTPTFATPTPLPATPTPPHSAMPSPYGELHLAYMFGDANGNFRPNGNLTRAEAATILARTQLLNFEHGIQVLPPGMEVFDSFADVRPGQWFYYYVAWAYDAGLIQGYAGYFRPNDPITREELAAIIVRAGATNTVAGSTSFPDAGHISSWAREYVNIAYRHGLIIGNSNGNFRPQDNITRGETATAINRLLGRIDSRMALNAVYVENIYHVRQFPDVAASAWYFASVMAAANDHYLTRDSAGAIDWKMIVR